MSGLARTVRIDGVTPIEVDWTDVSATRTALRTRSFDAALLYCPDAPAAWIDALRAAVSGRVVRLLPSAVASPPFALQDLPDDGMVHVVLGWTQDRQWHTPQQLSDAALEALASGADAVLGLVTPWTDRPGTP